MHWLLALLTTLSLAACGEVPLNSPDHPPISSGIGPQVWVPAGYVNNSCTYDRTSIPAKVACDNQLKMLEDAQLQMRGRTYRYNIRLRCDAGTGSAREIRHCTMQYIAQLEGYPYYLNLDRWYGDAPRVVVSW